MKRYRSLFYDFVKLGAVLTAPDRFPAFLPKLDHPSHWR